MPDEPRPLRADARRNRELVLTAAQEAFAAEGLSVPIDEIARRAGVGAGTVYRHFPTKEALFTAAIIDRVERAAAYARELAEAADAGAAFFEFLAFLGRENGVKRDLADAVGSDQLAALGASADLTGAIGTLLRRAQRDGAIRSDIDVDDLMLILKAGFGATREADERQRNLTFAVILDGLRRVGS
ncbi:TetR/AcrR family transcriptional regulator [Nocardia sp. NPDC057663]|uniref:TetR/AcrR family transcriptional regulator n=1 Tax=Nocardia sp. NPDC057663 TaxID=3346201 RepID=UPI00366D15DF